MARLRNLLAALRRGNGYLDLSTGRWLPPIAGADGAEEEAEEEGAQEVEETGDEGAQEDADADQITPDDDWKAKARKHERTAKRRQQKIEKLEAELRKYRDRDKSEIEKAIEKAREEARAEALREAEAERRADRLEVAVTRVATRGIKVGSGDEAKSVRFADPEDALLRIERGLQRGDIDEGDLFTDEGRVNTEALTDELVRIASEHPHLVSEGNKPKPKGDPDARKGGPATNDLEAMTPEDHARRKYGSA